MALKTGIIGLPNVGKSTIFNALVKANVEAVNYPFATIQPNIGTVIVPDERLIHLSNLFHPRKTVYTTMEFVDISGLMQGSSRGEGLGNRFLSHIRQSDLLVEIVRCFVDENIIHVHETVDPKRDMEIIDLELVFADLETVAKRKAKTGPKALSGQDKLAKEEYEILNKFNLILNEGTPLRVASLSEKEVEFGHNELHLLTLKPKIYVANIAESDLATYDKTPNYQIVSAYAKSHNSKLIPISGAIEAEISQLDVNEQQQFLASYNIKQTGLNQLIVTSYDLLSLATFFTVGDDECRGWTFKKGMNAQQCAGLIHTDFARGFIKAEVYPYNDIIIYGSESNLKASGKIRLEGKQYLVQDGDIIFYRFNV